MKTFTIADYFKGRELTTEVSSFLCNHCGRPFFVQESIEERKRTSLRAIPCPECKKSNFALALNRHGLVVVKIKSQTAYKLASYTLIEWDLTDVEMACSKLLNALQSTEIDEIVCASLWTHALIKYARCFNSVGGKREALSNDIFPKYSNDQQGGLGWHHKYFMDYRNKHIAHSINTFERAEVGVIVSAPEEKEENIFDIGVLSSRVTYSYDATITKLQELASIACGVVRDDIAKLHSEVLEEARATPIAELHKLPVLHSQVYSQHQHPSKVRG